MEATYKPNYQQDDDYKPERSAKPASAISAVPVIAAASD
jgi:hypothetical protein